MTNSPHNARLSDTSIDVDKRYFAVRPQLVLQAANVFGITSSILERGAKKMYNRAVKVSEGKQAGRWGRHQKAVIEQFCLYTKTPGSELLLPWEELVEHAMNYDDKEGISARTGNRPLATVIRLSVNSSALQQSRQNQQKEIVDLAQESSIPEKLIEHMERGEWPEVATSTAEAIANSLDIPLDQVFTPVQDSDKAPEENEQPAVDTASQTHLSQDGAAPILKNSTQLIISIVLIISLCLVAISAYLYSQSSVTKLDADALTNTKWHATIVVANQNIPVPSDIVESWSNGAYFGFNMDGSLGFNWIDSMQLIALPLPDNRWSIEGNELTLKLGEIFYIFTVGDNVNQLEALNTTHAFKMTLKRIRQPN